MTRPGQPYLDRRCKKLNSPPQGQPWCWLTRELIESAAFRALSRQALKTVMRVLVEHMAHGGKDNGRLPVTHGQFAAFGIRKQTVPTAIAEAVCLGFMERTDRGHRAWGEYKGRAAMFRITWLPVFEADDLRPPTNEWKRFTDLKSAKDAVREMRRNKSARVSVSQSIRAHPRVRSAAG